MVAERRYAGLDADERAGERRERLLAAELDVLSRQGWNSSTVQDVCRAAGLSPRYLYEAFGSREALVLALLDRVADEAEAVALAALTGEGDPEQRAARVLESLTTYFTSDPRRIRVALMESLAAPAFRAKRRDLLESFGQLGARLMRPLRGMPSTSRHAHAQLTMAASLLAGGLVEQFIAWEESGGRGALDVGVQTAVWTAAARS